MVKSESKEIRWKISLAATPEEVFRLISTDQGREAFWADKSRIEGNKFHLEFASGEKVDCKLIKTKPPKVFIFEYFGASRVEFALKGGAEGGTEFEVFEPSCPVAEWEGNFAGWVAWLYCLKAAADFGVVLRSRSPKQTWAEGFVDG